MKFHQNCIYSSFQDNNILVEISAIVEDYKSDIRQDDEGEESPDSDTTVRGAFGCLHAREAFFLHGLLILNVLRTGSEELVHGNARSTRHYADEDALSLELLRLP